MQYDVLANECDANEYGKRKIAMSMMVHAAPRVLKLGKAVGEVISSMGSTEPFAKAEEAR